MQIKPNSLILRLYQQSILNTALQSNTLVVIPTGLGKTMIAAALASIKLKDGKVLFLAPTKPLCIQHENTFKKFFNIEDQTELVTLTGEVKPAERKRLWSEAKIVFSTPQTAENDLLGGLFHADTFSLIIIDEAHRAIGDYSYVWMAKQFNSKGVQILALTASPASEKEKLDEVRRNLFISKVEVRSENDPDVRPYVQEKKIEKVIVELPKDILDIRDCLELSLKQRLITLKNLGVIESSDVKRARKVEFLKLQGQLVRQGDPDGFLAVSVLASCIKLMHSIELVETQGVAPLIDFLDGLNKQQSKAAKNLLQDWNVKKAAALAKNFRGKELEHPKFIELVRIVKEHLGEKMIIFTQYRSGVEKIVKELEKIDGCRPVRFIGQKEGMTQKKQVETIEDFKEGKYNVLCATCILEEGIHCPEANIGIFFEAVPSSLREVQRTGRIGRTNIGKIYLLITKSTIDEKYYWVAHHKKKNMDSILKNLKMDNTNQKSLDEF